MTTNTIVLTFDKLITNLAGNRLGNQIFQEQVSQKIDINVANVVIFPFVIEDIASSFIEGFYKELGEKYGKSEAIKIMELKAENEDTDKKIKDSIETFGV